MGMEQILFGNDADQPVFNLVRGFARRKTEPVGNAEDVGIHRKRGHAESHRHHHIGGLAADAGQRHQLFAGLRHLTAEIVDQHLRQGNDVFGLVAVKPDGLDMADQIFLAERQHFSGVSATLNSARVARFTPTSVACAESATATSRVKGLVCSSSPFGSGR